MFTLDAGGTGTRSELSCLLAHAPRKRGGDPAWEMTRVQDYVCVCSPHARGPEAPINVLPCCKGSSSRRAVRSPAACWAISAAHGTGQDDAPPVQDKRGIARWYARQQPTAKAIEERQVTPA